MKLFSAIAAINPDGNPSPSKRWERRHQISSWRSSITLKGVNTLTIRFMDHFRDFVAALIAKIGSTTPERSASNWKIKLEKWMKQQHQAGSSISIKTFSLNTFELEIRNKLYSLAYNLE